MSRGGYRIGAGRPSKSGQVKKSDIPGGEPGPPDNHTPLEYILKVMNDTTNDTNTRLKAASLAAPFIHSRVGEGAGKKEERSEKAKSAGSGKFSAAPPPLRVIK